MPSFQGYGLPFPLPLPLGMESFPAWPPPAAESTGIMCGRALGVVTVSLCSAAELGTAPAVVVSSVVAAGSRSPPPQAAAAAIANTAATIRDLLIVPSHYR